MSIIVEKFEAGWVAHGFISIGHVHVIGMTESQARQKAADQIRAMHSKHLDQKFAELRARYPDYFSRKLA